MSYVIAALTLTSPVNGQPNTIDHDSMSDGNIIEELNDKLGLKNKQHLKVRARIFQNNILGVTVVLLSLLSIALYIYRPEIIMPFLSGLNGVIVILVVFYVFIFDIIFLSNYMKLSNRERGIDEEIRNLENQIDLAKTGIDSLEKRAEKLFELHQFELEKYYKQNLSQGNRVFNAGTIFVLLGFLITGISIYLVSNSVENVRIVAILGGIGTILSDFIAAIYLRMFSDTTKASAEFQKRLATTHNLLFGNFMASKIKKEELRDNALSALASELAKGTLLEDEKGN